MKTIALLNQKGGCSKSTLVRSLAVCGLLDGLRAVIIDADPQQTLAAWGKRRECPAPSIFTTASKPLIEVVQQAKNAGAELCFIDTPPHLRASINIVANLADCILVPVRPSPDDLTAIGATLDILKNVNVPSAIVITQTAVKTQSATMAKSALLSFGFQIAPVMIGDRVAHQYAAIDGLTAMEYEPSGKAAAEISALWEWVKTSLLNVKI